MNLFLTNSKSLHLKSFRAFANKIIDYAGLFPPASLNLHDAFTGYSNYIKSEHKWMLSRFICPAKLFPELETIAGNIIESSNETFSFSVLGGSGNNDESLINRFKTDLEKTLNFCLKYSKKVCIEVFELKLHENSEHISLFSKINESIKNEFKNNVDIFYEVTLNNNWKEILSSVTEAISEINRTSHNKTGFKLRTGGITASSFPSSEKVACVIKTCKENIVPLKTTAGLHHPVKHYREEVQTKMHGFINIFGAGIVAHSRNLPENTLIEIINDEDAGSFHFTDESFSWKDYSVTVSEIEEARKNFILSFGSCSFDEPVEDLKKLGLLK